MDALLVVDLQQASFAGNDKHDQQATIDRVNRLAEHGRAGGGSVIFALHDGTADESLLPRSDGWQLHFSIRREGACVRR